VAASGWWKLVGTILDPNCGLEIDQIEGELNGFGSPLSRTPHPVMQYYWPLRDVIEEAPAA